LKLHRPPSKTAMTKALQLDSAAAAPSVVSLLLSMNLSVALPPQTVVTVASPPQTVVTELPSPSVSTGIECCVPDLVSANALPPQTAVTESPPPSVSIGIQCCVPDLLFVNAIVPKTLFAAGYRASLPPFGDRKPPTYNDPITDGRRGSARDLGNMGLKTVVVYVQNATVIRQPRDGSCLYHALIHGLGHSLSILELRKELVGFVRQNSAMKFHGQSLESWIKWECCCRLFLYCVC